MHFTLELSLGALFNWCAKKKKLDKSPMTGVDRPWEGGKPRDRVFSDDELRKLWTCGAHTDVAAHGDIVKLDPIETAYLKLLILTGKRRGAYNESQRKRGLSAMRWGQIQNATIEKGGEEVGIEIWEPPLGVKNKRMHALPLPKLARRILIGLKPKDAKDEDFVFPNPKMQDGNGLNNRFYGRVQKLSGVEDFFPHATRHTVETGTAKLKVKPHIRDLLFGHASNRGSGKDYDHHDYLDEMLEALEKWAEHIEKLVIPDGVKVLR